MTKLKQIKITFIKTEITNETETSTVDAQEIQLYTDPNLPGTSNQELVHTHHTLQSDSYAAGLEHILFKTTFSTITITIPTRQDVHKMPTKRY